MKSTLIVYLDRRDTIASACELVHEASPQSQLWMVLPWRIGFARKLVNLRRLQRLAEQMGVDLRLVSRHLETRNLAREAGLAVHSMTPWSLRLDRRRRTKERPARRLITSDTEAGRWARRRPVTLHLGALLGTVLVMVILVGALGATALAVVPSAEVRLNPVAQPVQTQFDTQASVLYSEVDFGRAIVPARVVQVIIDGRGETPASGSMDVPDGHASGEIVFANRTDTAVFVPKGTIVRTSSGVNARFYTVTDSQVPGVLFGYARVGIIALEPGTGGNVGQLTINVVEGDLANQIDCLNDTAIQGGTISRMPIVHYRDFDRLRADMIDQLQQQAYEELLVELDDGEYVPPESIEVLVMSQHFDQVVDQASEALSMSMKVVARGVAVDGRGIENLATRFLEQQLPEGYQVIEDSLVLSDPINLRVEGRDVYLTVQASGAVAQSIDTEQIRADLRGKTIAEADAYLSQNYELSQQPAIEVTPSVWDRMPLLPGRMDVRVSVGSS